MTVRAVIEDETVDRVNEKLGDVMKIDPESAGMDTKIGVLLDELESTEYKLRRARNQSNQDSWEGR